MSRSQTIDFAGLLALSFGPEAARETIRIAHGAFVEPAGSGKVDPLNRALANLRKIPNPSPIECAQMAFELHDWVQGPEHGTDSKEKIAILLQIGRLIAPTLARQSDMAYELCALMDENRNNEIFWFLIRAKADSGAQRKYRQSQDTLTDHAGIAFGALLAALQALPKLS